jgi:uncharacterized protein (UPF0332 family)
MSRAYYAAFYAARAALEFAGNEAPKTHSGLRSKFAELTRGTPELGPEIGRALSQLETARTRADYGTPEISVAEVNAAIAQAEHLVEVVDRMLGSDANPDK